jgi:hypothetical protein
MNYITLIILLSLSTYTFCSKSHPSEDNQSEYSDHADEDEEDGKENLLLASYVYEKLKFTFDTDNNPDYITSTEEKPLTFAFEEITEEDDWKVVAKLTGHFVYGNGTDLPVHLSLLKYAAVEDSDTVDEEHVNDVIVLSTTEIRSVKSPYRMFLTCNACEEVLETIGDANDGLHITEEGCSYDSIGKQVTDNGDGSFTLSMIILLNNDLEYSEITSMYNDDDEIDQEMQSNSSEIDMDIDNSLQVFLKDKFAQKIEEADKMNGGQIKKFLV